MNSFSYRRTLHGSGPPSPPPFSGMRLKLRNGPENRSEPAPTWPPAILCPPGVPQYNAYAERFVRSIKQECLSRLVFFSERQLHKTISIFIGHYGHRRNHQWIENKLMLPEIGLTIIPINSRSGLAIDEPFKSGEKIEITIRGRVENCIIALIWRGSAFRSEGQN